MRFVLNSSLGLLCLHNTFHIFATTTEQRARMVMKEVLMRYILVMIADEVLNILSFCGVRGCCMGTLVIYEL